MLEKKEFERNLQMDEFYTLIAQQEEQIQVLSLQLQSRARKDDLFEVEKTGDPMSAAKKLRRVDSSE